MFLTHISPVELYKAPGWLWSVSGCGCVLSGNCSGRPRMNSKGLNASIRDRISNRKRLTSSASVLPRLLPESQQGAFRRCGLVIRSHENLNACQYRLFEILHHGSLPTQFENRSIRQAWSLAPRLISNQYLECAALYSKHPDNGHWTYFVSHGILAVAICAC